LPNVSGVTLEDCFFVDDGEHNVAAARDAGMAGFHFQGDVANLRYALGDSKVLP
jgi:FMN phosphatase YigB (HAD superfamily)